MIQIKVQPTLLLGIAGRSVHGPCSTAKGDCVKCCLGNLASLKGHRVTGFRASNTSLYRHHGGFLVEFECVNRVCGPTIAALAVWVWHMMHLTPSLCSRRKEESWGF